MKIPKGLAYLLERDQELDGAVKLSISQLEPWIKNSNLPFFPEYTKHDIEHIESVLQTAEGLIRDEAWESVTSADAAVLILAVLLHDCAMHISEDGFLSLLEGNRNKQLVPGMADKPWDLLWEDFYGEASRFDGRKLIGLFGVAQPVRRPPTDANQFTKRDRLLIGEFLRRHHPRLAQEIARFGVPTKGNTSLIFTGFVGAKDYIPALSGLVARSHGADVRRFLPYLEENFDIRQYKNIHAVFLMSLLRVADYLQIESERAPGQVLKVRQITSPVSLGEWQAHAAIKDIRHTDSDPEAIFVDAFPEDVRTFLRVESWLRGIQHELDASWAVLGEVYGRYKGLDRLGLLLRRVKSSIDDPTAFAKKVTYIPKRAVFSAADADLLKLLIEPLYGNDPGIGLRELIQNSVDAVRELEQFRKDVASIGDVPQEKQEADVLVSVEKDDKGNAWITVSDKGIGMTQEIITEYFLAAGASFRRSENWRKSFETSEGKSKVLRAGRFGVGALASFLLGPEIEVSTRHVEEETGIIFKASVDTDSIELRKISRPVGTTIRIPVKMELAENLGRESISYNAKGIDWDWYCLSKPSVHRRVFAKSLGQKFLLPDPNQELPPNWHSISHPDYQNVLWTYSIAPAVSCNGIKTGSAESSWRRRFGLSMPKLSIFDPDGKLPLNLQRTELTEKRFPFEEALAEDVINDFIAHALVFGPTTPPTSLNGRPVVGLRYPGSGRSGWREEHGWDWYFVEGGFAYHDASILNALRYKTILIAFGHSYSLSKIQFDSSITTPTISFCADGGVAELDWRIRGAAEDGYFATTSTRDAPDWSGSYDVAINLLRRKGSRFLISDSALKRAKEGGPHRITRRVFKALKKEWTIGSWSLLSAGDSPPPKFDFKKLVETLGAELGDNTIINEVYLDESQAPVASPVAKRWMEVLPTLEIPFDPKVRREKLKQAYNILSKYVEAHEAAQRAIAEKQKQAHQPTDS